jgi:hypothetical protein
MYVQHHALAAYSLCNCHACANIATGRLYRQSTSEYLAAQGPPAGQPGQSGLAAILENEKDSEDDPAVQEQVEADYEERLQIGGGLLKQVTIKSGYLLKKGERRKVSCCQGHLSQ